MHAVAVPESPAAACLKTIASHSSSSAVAAPAGAAFVARRRSRRDNIWVAVVQPVQKEMSEQTRPQHTRWVTTRHRGSHGRSCTSSGSATCHVGVFCMNGRVRDVSGAATSHNTLLTRPRRTRRPLLPPLLLSSSKASGGARPRDVYRLRLWTPRRASEVEEVCAWVGD